MPAPSPARLYRFGSFEADPATGELRRQGIRIKLNAQPFQVLTLLLDRPNDLLTREEIARHLWPGDTFVDYEHGVNSAINRIREALRDTAANPRFIETLARRGYRFIAPVERIPSADGSPIADHIRSTEPTTATPPGPPPLDSSTILDRYLATPEDLPKTSHPTVQTLFVLLQIMYIGYYVGALANVAEISDIFSALPHPTLLLDVMIVTAAILIPVRTFALSAALLKPPSARQKLLKLWLFLLPLDLLWSLAPFLLIHHMSFGLALACTPLLIYSPFAQRSLILMGAADPAPAKFLPPHTS